jgi:hypothetical protein
MPESAEGRPNRRTTLRRSPKTSTRSAYFDGPLGLGANVSLRILDVSEIGACLHIKIECKPGRAVELNLESPSHSRPIKLPAMVVWSMAAAEGGWCVGVRFDKRMSFSELHTLARM